MKIVEVTPQNVHQETLFCIKDIKKPGFDSKRKWFEKRYNEGLRLRILKNEVDKMLGFIEFTPALQAWRLVNADSFMFIHCIVVYSKKDRNQGYGSLLINEAEKEAKAHDLSGLCVMTSNGSWLADKTLFKKNGFIQIDKKDRFELLSKKWNSKSEDPKFYDWTKQQKKYKGWHLVYADQCPWHDKSAFDLLDTAMDYGIDLKLTKINTAKEAKKAPSGYGTFNLLHNGTLIEDHYISATRFRNILKKELTI
jgi:N-acetylglutamate synthase-like GNAT family acetyltransferase